jgi:dihydrofolate synthase
VPSRATARSRRSLSLLEAMFAAARVARALVRSSAAHAPFAPPAFGVRCRRARSSSSRPRDDEAKGSADAALVDMDAFLAPFQNHERTGVPKGAGVASNAAERFDLGRMRRLLAALGDPHVGYPVIHVAGTKGKGSVVSFLASILREAGVNTGTYKSPHVRSVNERIVCGPVGGRNGALEAGAAAAVAAAKETTRAFAAAEAASSSKTTADTLSYFEALTAFAFLTFSKKRVECAVIEVGVGGSTDATNVVPASHTAASVLCSLGDDHLDALGGSLASVAAAKAGITRFRRPVFIGAQPSIEHEALLLSNVYARGGRLVDEGDVAVAARLAGVDDDGRGDVAQVVDFEIASRPRDDDGAKPLETRSLLGVRMRALGPHQRENARLAVSVIEFLRKGGGQRRDGGDLADFAPVSSPWSRVADDDVRRGLENAVSPGCFEILRRPGDPWDPGDAGRTDAFAPVWIVADGAHTADSAKAAFATLRETTLLFQSGDDGDAKKKEKKNASPALAVVIAMASDKNHVEVMRAVSKAEPNFVFCAETLVSGGTARAAPATALRDAFELAAEAAKTKTASAWGGKKMNLSNSDAKTRVFVIPELERAMAEAVDAVRGRGGGVVCVTGSLNVVARAEAWANQSGGAAKSS